jgi:hypothetical protein
MCVTDRFSKSTELIVIPDKCAEKIGEALFSRWFCRHGMSLKIVSDQGKEFCNDLVHKLLLLLKKILKNPITCKLIPKWRR